ncbi:hypothetical protein CVT26_010667 [Gymnopilus dilepis]|uniref:Uncharacterized protein n=1 Tax=Gymnopilus dilepis TaxID=231916 RepID=A0A409Y115_9AGAR|nr:hypothetical protein CVT26_010667 [Gymnopilus dilepis]
MDVFVGRSLFVLVLGFVTLHCAEHRLILRPSIEAFLAASGSAHYTFSRLYTSCSTLRMRHVTPVVFGCRSLSRKLNKDWVGWVPLEARCNIRLSALSKPAKPMWANMDEVRGSGGQVLLRPFLEAQALLVVMVLKLATTGWWRNDVKWLLDDPFFAHVPEVVVVAENDQVDVQVVQTTNCPVMASSASSQMLVGRMVANDKLPCNGVQRQLTDARWQNGSAQHRMRRRERQDNDKQCPTPPILSWRTLLRPPLIVERIIRDADWPGR